VPDRDAGFVAWRESKGRAVSHTVIHIDEPTIARLHEAVASAKSHGSVVSTEVWARQLPLYSYWSFVGFIDCGGTATVVVDETGGTEEAPLFV
jgi:hypothetical protein